MFAKSVARTIALAAAVALAAPVFAKPITKTINISQPAKFGKAELKAGQYTLLIDGSRVTIKNGKDVLGEAEGRWEERDVKPPYNSVLIGQDGVVKEVRFAGNRSVLVLSD
jgi:hypothetical protein